MELCEMVYTTNSIKCLNAQMQRSTSSREVFSNDAAVIKILFLNVKSFTNKRTKRHRRHIAMNQWATVFGDRFSLGIFDLMKCCDNALFTCALSVADSKYADVIDVSTGVDVVDTDGCSPERS